MMTSNCWISVLIALVSGKKVKRGNRAFTLGVLLVFSLFVFEVASAMIVPTGGLLASSSYAGRFNDSTSVDLASDFGSFEVLSRSVASVVGEDGPIENSSISRSIATIDPARLDFVLVVDGFRNFSYPEYSEIGFGGSATAQFSFALTEPGPMEFQLASGGYGKHLPLYYKVQLRNSEGVIMSCHGFLGACFEGDLDTIGEVYPDIETIENINLDTGEYEIYLTTNTEIAAGTSVGGSLAFSFAEATAVPIPAAVWLFGSGIISLCGLFRMRKE